MEISILLTILLVVISLGGLFLQEGKICLDDMQQIDDFVVIKYILKRPLYHWAVKLVMRGCYLLNTVALTDALKATQIALIQSQIYKFEG